MKKLLRKWLGIDADYNKLRIELAEKTRPNLFNIGDTATLKTTVPFSGITAEPVTILSCKIHSNFLYWTYEVFNGKGIIHGVMEFQLSNIPKPEYNATVTTLSAAETNGINLKSKTPKK